MRRRTYLCRRIIMAGNAREILSEEGTPHVRKNDLALSTLVLAHHTQHALAPANFRSSPTKSGFDDMQTS